MKKLISLFLALMMAILAIPALAEDIQDPDTAVEPNIDPDFLVGAWESWTGNPLENPRRREGGVREGNGRFGRLHL